jgi:hypothetical protein
MRQALKPAHSAEKRHDNRNRSPRLAERGRRLDCDRARDPRPCGVTLQPAAWRADLEGILGRVPKFRNVQRRS